MKTGREGSDAATGQGAHGKHRKLEEAGKTPHPGPLEGARPCHTWISYFWPRELGGNPFLLLEATQSVVIYYSSLWKLIHQADGKTSINPLVTEVCRMWCCENCKGGGGLPVGGGPTREQE